MLKTTEREIIEFIRYNQNKTQEEIKKMVRKAYPNEKIYNEDIERLIIQANSEKKEEKKSKSESNDFER